MLPLPLHYMCIPTSVYPDTFFELGGQRTPLSQIGPEVASGQMKQATFSYSTGGARNPRAERLKFSIHATEPEKATEPDWAQSGLRTSSTGHFFVFDRIPRCARENLFRSSPRRATRDLSKTASEPDLPKSDVRTYSTGHFFVFNRRGGIIRRFAQRNFSALLG